MERNDPPVKRPYDSSRRREQAEATRAAILGAARTRFLRDGVSSTTIASIADDAAVSVDTIYKSFGGKPGLVRAIVDQGLAGEGPIPAERRSDALQAEEPDPRRIIAGFGALTMEVAPRLVPLLLLVREAAAVDAAMADVWEDVESQRLRRMQHIGRTLAAAGHLRSDITPKEAGEIMWATASPELYERLVLQRRWSLARYGAFIASALTAALLPPADAP